MPATFTGSIFSDVVQAVGERVKDAIESPGVFSTAMPVYVRRRPVLLEGDGVPCVIVSPGPEGEVELYEVFGDIKAWAYPVTCVCVSKARSIHTASVDDGSSSVTQIAEEEYADAMRLREVVRNAVDVAGRSFPTAVPTVFDHSVTTGMPVETTGANSVLYHVSVVTVTHHSWEERGG